MNERAKRYRSSIVPSQPGLPWYACQISPMSGLMLHYRVEPDGILYLRLTREAQSGLNNWDGWFSIGFATGSSAGFAGATLLVFVPRWQSGYDGYALASNAGLAVYQAASASVHRYTGVLPDANTLLEPLVNPLGVGGAVVAEVQVRLAEAGGSYPVTALQPTPLFFASSWTNLAADYSTCTGDARTQYECHANLSSIVAWLAEPDNEHLRKSSF